VATTELSLRGERRIDWARPQDCPTGFETLEVHAGRADGGGPALEVAVARWTAAGRPTRETLSRLHALRVNKRATPVVLVALQADGTVVAFGPNSGGAPVDPFPAEQAERFFQAVLDEPNAIRARNRVSELRQALDATAMPGVKNSGLFANHYLRVGVPQREDWPSACSGSSPLLGLREHELVRRLGFTTTSAGADALLLSGSGPRPDAIAVLLEERESFDGASNRFAISPVAYGLRKAEEQGVAWLILARGSQLRLYPARVDLGVGRKGLAETFFELDLPHLTAENAGYLTLVFSAEALAEGGSTFEIMQASAQYAVALGERLRDKVYEEIIPELSLAVAEQMVALDFDMDAENLDLAYQVTLRIFFRLLFQVYAEDRKLLPYGDNARYDRNALKTVAQDLTDEPDQEFDPNSTSLWDDLTQVWKVIDTGDRAWGVPAYNGGLFTTDAETSPFGALIGRIAITNDVMGPVLKALLLDEDEDGAVGPVDFRSLSVREFGTIYEGLLESSLGLAEVDLTLDDKGTWLPAKRGDDIYAEVGDVYFHNTSGQRRATGSYFTPSFVVEHLLERALDPALDDHLARVAELLAADDQAGAAEAFFDFSVADLAMGSGHFLTAAVDHIEAKMAAFLAEPGHQIPGVAKELNELLHAAREAIGPDAPEPEPSSLLRRQIARRCIYGLDINPIAVELARVSIWIHTFVRGLPMSSLDHNLVCANSLTGIGSVDEALDVLVPGRKAGMPTLFDGPIERALTAARTTLLDVSRLAEVNRDETRLASKAVKRARQEAETARRLFDAAVLMRIGQGDLVNAVDVNEIAALAGKPEAQDALLPLNPAHMPALFPEVFLRESGGFDVLVGNPPWEEVMVEEPKFWLRVAPGLLGLPATKMKQRIAALRKERSDLLPLLEADIEAAARVRKVLLAGPFPGLGRGDVDLYKVFAWRNWQLIRSGGRLGAVFPRSLLNAAGNAAWRDVALSGSDLDVLTLTNSGEWVFVGVDGRYSIALVSARVSPDTSGQVSLCGPFFSLRAFEAGRGEPGRISVDLLRRASEGAAFPQLPDSMSAEVFSVLRGAPRFDDAEHAWSFKPVREFDATNDRKTFDAGGEEKGRWPVYGGSSLYLWQPETGEYYAWADPKIVTAALQEKRLRQVNLKSSAFYGMPSKWAKDPKTLPCRTPRIAFRDVTNATNTRTCIAALVPGEVVLTNKAPYLLRVQGTEADEAFVLGVLSSIPLDWYARRFVELGMNFHIFNGLPIPDPSADDLLRARVVEIAGRLAARDDRFADWAAAVGVPVGSVSAEEQPDLEAELDALVAHLYGLDRDQVIHIFETFHRGWDYRPRLDAVLGHFDRIAGA
jgi:hypothetical protein